MNRVNRSVDENEMRAFFRRTDKDLDHKINYSEFLEAFSILNTINSTGSKSIDNTSNFNNISIVNNKESNITYLEDKTKRSPENIVHNTPYKKRSDDDSSEDLLSNYVKRSYTTPGGKKSSVSPKVEIKNRSPVKYHQGYLQQQPSQILSANRMIKEQRLSSSSLSNSTYKFKTPGKLTMSMIKLNQNSQKHSEYQSHHSNNIQKNLYNDLAYDEASPKERNNTTEGTDDLRKLLAEEKISLLKPKEEDEFVQALKNQINNNRELECLKNDLALRKDFNVYDVFHIFDKNKNGYLTGKEFEAGLNKFDIKPNKDESILIMKRLDRNFDGTVKYII